ncbi:MAG: transcription antitermination factor NusB [Planctomycetota bacterium]
MTTARQVVTQRLARRVRQFPVLEISALDTATLDRRDAALAAAIDHAVARRWLTLRAILAGGLRRPWDTLEPNLRAVLLAGAAQCFFLQRIPDHALINEAVEHAKAFVRPGAAKLVNAVLRRTAGLRDELLDADDPTRRDTVPLADGRAWRLREPVFAGERWLRTAQRTSHPEPVLARWRKTLGADAADRLATHDLVHPPIILTGLAAPPPESRPHREPGFHVYEGPPDALSEILAPDPAARVQDPASARPVAATADLAPALVVDACAGRGTKTRQLAELHPDARIVATDVDAARRAVLHETFDDREQVEVVEPDRLAPHRRRADLLLLDVPCSNTGVLARRVEARYRHDPAHLQQLVELQREIVTDTVDLLAPGGHLLYATCSIDPAENEEQVRWIEQRFGMRAVSESTHMPTGLPGDPATEYADGGSWALLRRT